MGELAFDLFGFATLLFQSNWVALPGGVVRLTVLAVLGVLTPCATSGSGMNHHGNFASRAEKLRRAIEIETVGIIFFSTSGAITDANDAFLRMSGYTREDLQNGLSAGTR